MKLSEAVMLGSTQTKLNPYDWDHCLIGMGFHAVAGLSARISSDDMPIKVYALWPWLEQIVGSPDFMPLRDDAEAHTVISFLAVRVSLGDFSLEAAVDWIRSVEPEEPCSCVESVDSQVEQEKKLVASQ